MTNNNNNNNKGIQQKKGNEQKMMKQSEVAGKTISRIRETQQERENRKANEWELAKKELQANLIARHQKSESRLLSKKEFANNSDHYKAYIASLNVVRNFMFPLSSAIFEGKRGTFTDEEKNQFFPLWKSVLANVNIEGSSIRASSGDIESIHAIVLEVKKLEKNSPKSLNSRTEITFKNLVEFLLAIRLQGIETKSIEQQDKERKERNEKARLARKAKIEEQKKEEELKKAQKAQKAMERKEKAVANKAKKQQEIELKTANNA